MDERRLIELATGARAAAYAPYSGFPVGAALLTESGEIVTGCNVENAAFSHTICAERTAVFRAIAEGHRAFIAIAVVGPADRPAITPCGSCRQVLSEFSPDLVVLAAGPEGARRYTMRELLPASFSSANLND